MTFGLQKAEADHAKRLGKLQKELEAELEQTRRELSDRQRYYEEKVGGLLHVRLSMLERAATSYIAYAVAMRSSCSL